MPLIIRVTVGSSALFMLLRCTAPNEESFPPRAAVNEPDAAPRVSILRDPPGDATAVAPSVYVAQRKRGTGQAIDSVADGDGLLVLTAYGPGDANVVASMEQLDWRSLEPWWQSALRGALVGDERRLWLCGTEAKKEWGDLSNDRCVVVDVELVTHSTHGVQVPGT